MKLTSNKSDSDGETCLKSSVLATAVLGQLTIQFRFNSQGDCYFSKLCRAEKTITVHLF